ncbi:MAG: DVU0298 family protein [Chloroflexota bacterium]
MSKKQINTILLQKDYRRLICLSKEDKHVWRVLQSNLYNTDERLRYYSIEVIAVLLSRFWHSGGQEKVMDYVRRLIWSITDESGGIGWSAPQTIAEIVLAIPQLRVPFVNIMIGRAFNEPILIKSGLWGIGRLGLKARPSVELFQDSVLASFSVNDPETLGLAAWASGEMRFRPSLPHLETLRRRPEPVCIYTPPSFSEKPVGAWAREALAKVDPDTVAEGI